MALTAAFVGPPGCGKSTAIGKTTADPRLRSMKVEVLDISSSPDAPFIRSIASAYDFGSPLRILLFWILRLQQDDMIQQRKNGADIILMDSCWWTTLANDVYGNGVPRVLLDWLGRYIKQWPDITFFLDVPLEVAQKRKQSKTFADPEFAKRVWQGYQELARESSWVRIDGTQKPDRVAERCIEVILAKTQDGRR